METSEDKNQIAMSMLLGQLTPTEAGKLFDVRKQQCHTMLHAFCKKQNPDLYDELLSVQHHEEGKVLSRYVGTHRIYKNVDKFIPDGSDEPSIVQQQIPELSDIDAEMSAHEKKIEASRARILELRVARGRAERHADVAPG